MDVIQSRRVKTLVWILWRTSSAINEQQKQLGKAGSASTGEYGGEEGASDEHNAEVLSPKKRKAGELTLGASDVRR